MSEERLIDFVIHSCLTCGCMYAITKKHEVNLRRTHNNFYCPNGHNHYFPGETDSEKIKTLENKMEGCKTRSLQKTQTINTLEKQVRSYKMLYAKEKKKTKKP